MKRAYDETPEGQIRYITEGAGDAILLLHGTPMSSEEFAGMVPILGKHYRAVAMDTLGYGMSDKSPKRYTIEEYTRNTVKFMDALGIEKTSIVGHLTGAAIAGELAASHPDRVDKLVLLGMSLYSPEERKMFMTNPHFTEPMAVTEDGSFLLKLWETNRTGAPDMLMDTVYKMTLANLLAGPPLHDAHLAAFEYDKALRLPLIKAPTLVISGDKDMFYGKLEEVEKLIPRCKTKVVPGKTFAYTYDKPEEFCQIIMDFLKNPGV